MAPLLLVRCGGRCSRLLLGFGGGGCWGFGVRALISFSVVVVLRVGDGGLGGTGRFRSGGGLLEELVREEWARLVGGPGPDGPGGPNRTEAVFCAVTRASAGLTDVIRDRGVLE